MSRPGKKQNQEPFPWMWIPLLRVREKENMTKGKEKVSPKVKTKERVSFRLGQTIHTTRVLGTISLGISSLGINKTPMTPRAKGKAREGQDKGKGTGDQGKGRKVANVESDTWALEQPAATATGDQT